MDSKDCSQFKVLSTGEYILPPSLQESIDNIIKIEGYTNFKIFNKSVSTSGGNFMADLYEVNIKGETAEGQKETNIFVKNRIENSTLGNTIDIEECYSAENKFYRELSEIYDDIQNKANIPDDRRYNMVKSYKTVNPNAIILENLAKKGFTTLHRMEVLPLKFAELSIQQLARFHGLSWVLEKQQPEYFEKNMKHLTTNFIFAADFQKYINSVSVYIDNCVDQEKKIKLHNLYPRMLPALIKYWDIKSSPGSKFCLCHGDFRANNILMKRDGDEITKVIPVDYQLLNYGSPVMDFIFFILPSSDQEFRRQHIEYLKDLYYESLDKFLKYFDMNAESVYPRYEFEEEYKKRLEFGLIMSLILTPLFFTDEDVVPDINKEDLSTLTLKPDPKMNERIKGYIEDFEMLGIL